MRSVPAGEKSAIALALGARAVMVGRPILWALAWNGEDGVGWALSLSGTPTWTELNPAGTVTTFSAFAGDYDPAHDQLVILNVNVPTRLTPEQRGLFEQLAQKNIAAFQDRQFKEIVGIMEGTGTPDYARCVDISTAGAQKRHYFRTMWDLVRHDARDLLPSIRCPVLIACGGKDWVTPPTAAREMALMTPGARLVEIPDATHFGIIECGPELWDPIDELLERAFG